MSLQVQSLCKRYLSQNQSKVKVCVLFYSSCDTNPIEAHIHIHILHPKSELETSSKPQNISVKAISILPQKAQIFMAIDSRVENRGLNSALAQAERKATADSHQSWSPALQDHWRSLALQDTSALVLHQHSRIFSAFPFCSPLASAEASAAVLPRPALSR